MSTKLQNLFYQKPHSLHRLSEEIFITLPLYEAMTKFEPIYIHDGLFKEIFSPFLQQQTLTWDEQHTFIQSLFSITIDKARSNGKQCGLAYVDKQGEDPYQLSLVGNLGSGRAYYIGPCFNLKGEITPLMTSTHPAYSTGVLTLRDGIWSAFIGNGLYDEFSTKPSRILTILKTSEKHCIIIRIDEAGSLDRLTHLFYQPRPLTARQLDNAAKQLARLEAEKFIHRILHGCWSAGNTSLEGHLIDYDSICAVKGRQPQFSKTPNYIDNYFGFEHEAQIKNLTSLCDHPLINSEHVAAIDLKQQFMEHFYDHLAEGLSDLMGFDKKKTNLIRHLPELRLLAKTFYDLSHYTCYLSRKSSYTNYPSALFFHLFDFSILFRVYPLLALSKKFTEKLGLQLMTQSRFQQAKWLEEQKNPDLYEVSQDVISFLTQYFINTPGECSFLLEQKARRFITYYTELFQALQQDSIASKEETAARAYVINEDRFYLLPVLGVEGQLIDFHQYYPSWIINRFITDIIQATRRDPKAQDDGYPTDFRVYIEGLCYVMIHNQKSQYQVVVRLYPEFIGWQTSMDDTWSIDVDGQLVSATCEIEPACLTIKSTPLSSYQLATQLERDRTFFIYPYQLYRNKEQVVLTHLFLYKMQGDYYF